MSTSKFTPMEQKIALLLAKAESTTPAEAEALTEAAEKLMIRHGIEQAVINARRATNAAPEKIITDSLEFSGTYVLGWVQLGAAVVQAFGTMHTYVTYNSGDTRRVLKIVGYESDVAQAKTLITSLQLQATVALRHWWKNRTYGESLWHGTPSADRLARRTFIIGFGIGAAERIKSETTRVVSEDATGTTALALRDRRAEAEAHLPAKLGKGRGMSLDDGGAAGAGAKAGRAANVGTASVGGSTRAALNA